MQTPHPSRPKFLEDWVRTTATTTSAAAGGGGGLNPSPPPTARTILQAWADLRDPSLLPAHPDRLLAALQTLSAAALTSLHVADPHAKLLLSLLSSPSSPSEARPLILRLLYSWLRKSSRPSPALLSSFTSLLSSSAALLPPSPTSILLLGALSSAPGLPQPSLSACLDLVCRLLDEMRHPISSNSVPDLLAGIGYALSRAGPPHFTKILSSLLGTRGPPTTLLHGLMVLRLFEWCVSEFVAIHSVDRIELLCREISPENCVGRGYARFAIVLAAAGVLRAVRMVSSSSRIELESRVKNPVEESINFIAKYAVSGNLDGTPEHRLLLQCISLALVRCGPVSFSAPVLMCLFFALSNEIFPLPSFFGRSLGFPGLGLNEVTGHLDGVLFREAGAVTGVLCNQYVLADEESKMVVEDYMWEYSQEFYRNYRMAALVHRGNDDQLLGGLEKIAEAAFLMVVVFAAEVSKNKLNMKFNGVVRPSAAVKILVTFSCMEYLRRVCLSEYTDAVRSAVLTLQGDAALCASFVKSMPPYAELIGLQGLFALEGRRYIWSKDEVQTARMLFYLRVIPTCIALIPASMFGHLVAPTMFLYVRHPNEKVARASHSVFVAFISSGKDSEYDDRLALKEQFVFYYIESSLEVYPEVTPFEGLASGVAALVRHLPAGSPAIFYCVHSLVEKVTALCRKAMIQDATLWKNWEGNSEPCKKVLDLLLRLISLVDIQVFPYLLKQLAGFVVELPRDGQDLVLDEMYSQVAESDDVTRKPILVSWLQSLSYICHQKAPLTTSAVKGGDVKTSIGSASTIDGLELNRTCSHL